MTYELVITALSDPTRRAILQAIRSHERCVADLAAHLPVSRPAVSQHLRVLSDAGLLECRREGTKRLYRLAPGGAEELRRWLDGLWADALSSYVDHVAEHTADTRKDTAK